MTAAEFLVSKANLNDTSFKEECDAATRALEAGEIRFEIERFAFTANNVTYAAFGDAMKYWHFFPAPDGFGMVPVWGFATVVESTIDDIPVGEKYYGYYPMASHLIVSPAKLSPAGFFDSKAHRAELSPIYNFYNRCAGDAGYNKDLEEIQMLFRPLFTTSFLIDDFLDDNDFYGATQVVLSSASSKTAYGLAFQLAQREGIKVIGLTSAGNKDFVAGMGLYDEAVAYDDIETIDNAVPTVYVDMSGSGDVRQRLHAHFDDMLKYSCSVGATAWDQMGSNEGLKGPKPTLFFAPAQGQKRAAEWGQDGLQARIGGAWMAFVARAGDWVDVVEQSGGDAVTEVYKATVNGTVNPRKGMILSF